MKYAQKKEIAAKLAKIMHISASQAMQHIPYFKVIFQKNTSELSKELQLNEEEIEWLSQ